MIFDRDNVEAILAGRQTTTRWPVSAAEPEYRRRTLGVRDTGQSMRLVAPYEPKVGARIPVRSRAGARPSCSVVITSVRVEPHAAISFVEIASAGYRSTAAYRASWVRRHDREWVTREEEAADGLRACWWPRRRLDEEELAARFVAHWLDQLVWVVTFERDRRDAVRLLSKRPGSQGDYTTSLRLGLVTEPEAVDVSPERVVRAAQQQAVIDEARDHESLSARLERALREAERKDVNVTRQAASIKQRIAALEQKVRRTGRAA